MGSVFRHHWAFTVFLGFCVCAALAIANPSKAGLVGDISVGISPTPTGEFRYEYLIENFPESTVSINAFVLDVGDGAELHSFAGPANWTSDFDPNEDPFELAWVSNASESEIPIGGSGTFVFESPLDAALLPYFVAHLTPTGTDLGSFFGDIKAPAVVPTPELHADFDENDIVDSDDLVIWRAGFGATSGATRSIGDANVDGDVDGSDFLVWQKEFGSTAGNGARTSAVPEPASVLLLLAGMVAAAFFSRSQDYL